MIDPARALEFERRKLDVEGQLPAPEAPGSVTAAQPNGPTAILQDLNITFSSPYADVTVGQFKNPVSYEGFHSSSKLLFPRARAGLATVRRPARPWAQGREKAFQRPLLLQPRCLQRQRAKPPRRR